MVVVTPQNVILTQNVKTIAAKCNTYTKYNNINANVIKQIVITPELQVCSAESKLAAVS